MNLLKVLDKGLKSPYQNFTYEIGKEYHCDRFDENIDKASSDGFYAVDIEGLPYAYRYGREVWKVEVGGKSVEYNQYKRRYETIKLIEKANLYEIKKQAFSMREKLGYKLDEVIFPIHPLRGKAKQVTDREVKLLNDWDSVWGSALNSVRDSVANSVLDSIWHSVWDSALNSVLNSVWNSVWGSVWNSVLRSAWGSTLDSVQDAVWDSVRESVRAYISSIFYKIDNWKYYIEYDPGVNPFQLAIDLWRSGFVPCFDGKMWRLHSGKTAEVVYEQSRRKR